MTDIYLKLAELQKANVPCVLCTVVQTQGSTPRKAGSKMIVLKDGSIFGTIGGGSVELAAITEAKDLFRSGKTLYKSYQLEEDLNMHCGGSVDVYFDPLLGQSRMYIFGAGHIGRVLGKFASDLGFRIVFFDNRPDIYKEFYLEGAECIAGDYFKCIEDAAFNDDTYIVIMTHKHMYDEDILAAVARKPHAYLGMIGSRRKVADARKRFLAEGLLTEAELDKVNMPIGLSFAVETPEEIAISVLAKIIDTRNSISKA
jgi:xanthine dehydrogenase accessory factor